MLGRAWRALKPLLSALLTVAPFAVLADHDFYGGDFDGRSWLTSSGPSETGPIVFDDAQLQLGQDLYGGMFGSFRLSEGFVLHGVEMEVRRDVSQGEPGQLIARVMATTFDSEPLGPPGLHVVSGRTEYFDTLKFEQNVFHIGMRVIGTGTAEIVTTSGANGRGSPLANGNSFFHDPLGGFAYTNTENVLGKGTWDFSIGMINQFIPEPTSFAVLGAGCAYLLWRRPRRL